MIASSENRNQAVRWLHAFTIIGMVLGTLATADLQHPPLRYGATSTMAERCLLCLCTTMSGCSRTEYCSGNLCGMFRLTSAYWVDANRPTLGNQDPDSPMAFQRCALSSSCSAITVRRYMAAFERDCNDDDVIDCHDFVAIHVLGPYGCKAPLPDRFNKTFSGCMQNVAKLYGSDELRSAG